jgi:hypothetical protein
VLANVEMLGRGDALPEREREQMRRDVVAQLHELNHLVGDLVELAREEQPRRSCRTSTWASSWPSAWRGARPRADVRFVAELDFAPVRARAAVSGARSSTCSTTRASTARPAARST